MVRLLLVNTTVNTRIVIAQINIVLIKYIIVDKQFYIRFSNKKNVVLNDSKIVS